MPCPSRIEQFAFQDGKLILHRGLVFLLSPSSSLKGMVSETKLPSNTAIEYSNNRQTPSYLLLMCLLSSLLPSLQIHCYVNSLIGLASIASESTHYHRATDEVFVQGIFHRKTESTQIQPLVPEKGPPQFPALASSYSTTKSSCPGSTWRPCTSLLPISAAFNIQYAGNANTNSSQAMVEVSVTSLPFIVKDFPYANG